MAIVDCRFFSGYKPCGKSEICDLLCPSMSIPATRVLLIHLEALGAVVRSTSLLPAIKRKYPDSHITWVTQKPADDLLRLNPLIDRVLTTEPADLLQLAALEFDVGLCVDKSLKASGVLRQTKVGQVFGFVASARTGAILPATRAAVDLWQLGLNDHEKFFVNTKPETKLVREALELPAQSHQQSDEYVLPLTSPEAREARERRQRWLGTGRWLIGINTGCSAAIPYKKLSVETQRTLVRRLMEIPGVRIALLGGREDETRNQQIGHGLNCVQTPTQVGLRDGLVSVQACDVVVTGDSLGMHMAIGLQKWVVAWFGPTCAHEIDLYGRGVKVLSDASCAPCWKRSCEKSTMCYDLVPVDELLRGVQQGLECVSGAADSTPSNRHRRRSPTTGNAAPEETPQV